MYYMLTRRKDSAILSSELTLQHVLRLKQRQSKPISSDFFMRSHGLTTGWRELAFRTLEDRMKLRNINGTSGLYCNCGSWLQHWVNYSGQPAPKYCPVVGCMEPDLLGAHVQKDGSSDKKWYIYPLCAKHNACVDSLLVSDAYLLVSANVSETCGDAIHKALSGLGSLYSSRK
jgi:hypothetical protein